MLNKVSKNETRERIHERIRKRLKGTSERPRLAVFRSLAHTYAQVIDDSKGETLVAASTSGSKTGGNVEAAKKIGAEVARKALERGIKRVVFDRGGYIYHGRVKALADAAREAGLEF
jgi:large subunit ribosomal protein L18